MNLKAENRLILFLALAGALAATVVASAAVGQLGVSLMDVVRAVGSPLGLCDPPADLAVSSTLWTVRFPRIALGVLVGAALAVAGTVMQAVFSNPLAEPGIVGVSAGAAVGASAAIVFIPAALGGFAVPLAAFLTGLLAAFLVYALSRFAGRAEALTLVLTGIAVTAVCTAATSAAMYVAPTTARDQIVFWQMGSFSGANWTQVKMVGAVVVCASLWASAIAGKLDTLALGDRAAGHVGVNVQLVRMSAIALASLLTGAAVSYAGVIGFVGLVVPHALRLLFGPLNRSLIPASMLGGALLIALADIAARTLIPFADLPIGIFTALVGGPTFFILLRLRLRRGGRA